MANFFKTLLAGVALTGFLLLSSGCNHEEAQVPLEEGMRPRIALVGIKFQYQLVDEPTSFKAPESANVLFERLTDKLLIGLERNLKKTAFIDVDELNEAVIYQSGKTVSNPKIEVVPYPYRFPDLSEDSEWSKSLCEVGHLEYVFTLSVAVIPTHNQEPQFYVELKVADKTGHLILHTQEPLGVFWRQFSQNNRDAQKIQAIEQETSRVIRKEGVDFGNSENRAIFERAFIAFLERYHSLVPILEGAL